MSSRISGLMKSKRGHVQLLRAVAVCKTWQQQLEERLSAERDITILTFPWLCSGVYCYRYPLTPLHPKTQHARSPSPWCFTPHTSYTPEPPAKDNAAHSQKTHLCVCVELQQHGQG